MPIGYNSPYKTYIFGPIDIDTDSLVAKRIVHFSQEKVYTNRQDLTKFLEKLEEDIKKNGIKRPLEASWHLTPKLTKELSINVGESRYYVAKKLGIKKLPCCICIYVYKINSYTEKENIAMDSFVEGLKKILPFQGEKSGQVYGVVKQIPYDR